MNFLKPTKKKIAIFFGLLGAVAVWIWFFSAINERDIADIVLIPLLRTYVIFDFLTFNQFTPKCGGALWCFPTLPEMIFVVVFDLVILYIISCVITALMGRKNSKSN